MKPLGTFVAVLAAIAVAVFVFAPERLPQGVGSSPVPLACGVRASLVGQGKVVVFSNPAGKTLHNVRIVWTNSPPNQPAKEFCKENWAPGQSEELGWLQGWKLSSGDQVEASASGHLPILWTLR